MKISVILPTQLRGITTILYYNTMLPICIKALHYPPFLKRELSSLRQFLATGSPLKMMKNAFCSQDIQIFVLTFRSCIETA